MDEKNLRQTRNGFSRALLLTLTIVVVALWLLLTPGGLLGKADAVGYAVCHRIDLRSFHLAERTLPLCSRCTGMYLGALVTLIAFVAFRGKTGLYPSPGIRNVLLIFAGLWSVDGINSFISIFPNAPHLYTPQNWLRLLTGTLVGVSMATMIYPAFSQSAWRDWQPTPVIPSFRWLLGLLSALALILVSVLSENPLILYPLAILSSIGVLALLIMAYSVLTLTLFKRQNLAVTWRELWLPLLGALTLALSQVAIIDLLRFVVTGTWDGFQL
ncbi:MAG: DUF2085 domain-containing protein [Anaerolineales bacterium]|nr:MAG: DUF2085 domain-containing protein [Anaerolineales bacterium]